MSNLNVTNIQHESGAGNNLILTADGTTTIPGGTNRPQIVGYQQGIWTAAVTTETAPFSKCNWYRIGNAVTVFGIMGKPTSSANASLQIEGLPYNTAFNCIAGNMFGRYISLPSSGQAFTATYISTSSYLAFYNTNASAYEQLRYADFGQSGSEIYFRADYMTEDTTWQPGNGATLG